MKPARSGSVARWNREERLIVLSLFLTLFLVFGSGFNTAGVFFDPLLHHFGWTRAQLSSTQTVLGLSAGITAPFFGWLLDIIDASIVIAFGATLSGVGFLIASRANSFEMLAIAYVFLGVGIAAATLLPCSQVLANWFGRRRGMALGLAMAGTSLGGMLMTIVAAQTIAHLGWRAAFIVLALPMIIIVLPLVLIVVRTRPTRVETGNIHEAVNGLEVLQALASRSFWMIAIAQFSFAFAVTGGSYHMVPYLVGIGYNPIDSAFVLSATLGLASLGKPMMGAVADRIGGRLGLSFTMILIAFGQLLILGARSLPFLVVYAAIYGLTSGAPLALIPDLIADSLGLKRFGTLTGLTGVFTTIGVATGPLAGGWLFDEERSYFAAFVLFAAVSILGSLAALGCISLAPAEESSKPE